MARALPWSVAPQLIRRCGRLPSLPPESSISELLGLFPTETSLTIKRARSRFFMYEEHSPTMMKDKDAAATTIAATPSEFGALLTERDGSHYYWTAPMASVAPDLLRKRFDWYADMHDESDRPLLDPRGPSLWMGTSGSGTQCHYDVANNIILQLYGTKRVRCYSPSSGLRHLHVFPDAHPRARKSQVDFDHADFVRFPQFEDCPAPSLDVVLGPGDILKIPAFWFHHVENGRLPSSNENAVDGPSASLNSFSLSKPMLVAQQIFKQGSRLGRGELEDRRISVLRARGARLLEHLNIDNKEEWIERNLLEARFKPLENSDGRDNPLQESKIELTKRQLDDVAACVDGTMPYFEQIIIEQDENGDGVGIAQLVALHLMELWAVQLVGASAVGRAWREVLA